MLESLGFVAFDRAVRRGVMAAAAGDDEEWDMDHKRACRLVADKVDQPKVKRAAKQVDVEQEN